MYCEKVESEDSATHEGLRSPAPRFLNPKQVAAIRAACDARLPAAMKPANNGCAEQGSASLLNSGWYCTATEPRMLGDFDGFYQFAIGARAARTRSRDSVNRACGRRLLNS